MIPRAVLILGLVSLARPGHADGLSDDDLWRFRSSGVAVDAGVVAASPTALPTGLAKGFGAGVTFGHGLTWGAQVSWATATESAIGWTVTHDDFGARLTAGADAAVGRGSFGLQLGLGGTLVHETRIRIRGDIAGSTGMALEATATALAPAADLDAVVRVHVTGAWMLVLAAGPSVTRVEAKARMGWSTRIGVAWQL